MKKKKVLTIMAAALSTVALAASATACGFLDDLKDGFNNLIGANVVKPVSIEKDEKTGLTFTTYSNDTVSVACKDLVRTSVKIPETWNEMPVTAIDECGFHDCEELVELTIPDSVKTIGASAFNGCVALEEIALPNSVKTMGDSAFYGCTALTSITLSDSLSMIDVATFQGCTSLKEISIPDSVELIGSNAFYLCSGLTEIKLSDSVKEISFQAFRDCTALESVEFSSILEMIDDYAFYGCTALEEVDLPENLEVVGAYAFGDSGLTSISIPKNVQKIDDCVFAVCPSLKTVTFATNANFEMGTQVFRGCTALENIVLPDCLKTIPHSTFLGCTALKEVTMPKYVQVIRSGAFSYCNSLTEIKIGEYVTEIGNAFVSCSALTTVYNYSMLDIQAGAETYGGVALNATKVFTK